MGVFERNGGTLKDLITFISRHLFINRQSRATFDTTETRREFGPIIVDFNAIQTKVNLKYDTLQKAIVMQFGSRLGEDISDFFSQVSKARSDLEQQSLEVATTAEAVTFITYVQGNRLLVVSFKLTCWLFWAMCVACRVALVLNRIFKYAPCPLI